MALMSLWLCCPWFLVFFFFDKISFPSQTVNFCLSRVIHILKAIVPAVNFSFLKQFFSRGVIFLLTQWDAYVNSILHCLSAFMKKEKRMGKQCVCVCMLIWYLYYYIQEEWKGWGSNVFVFVCWFGICIIIFRRSEKDGLATCLSLYVDLVFVQPARWER